MTANTPETDALLRRTSQGDTQAWGELVGRHRDRLRRMVGLRLDRQLQCRIDPSDVIQESCLEAWERLPEYLRDPAVPFFLWLRFLTGQRLQILHRHHLGTQRRDAGREVSLNCDNLPEASSAAVAAQLLGHDPTPDEAAERAEMRARVQEALDDLDPTDREVLIMRHFEQLTTKEIATLLHISAAAAGKRYLRALERVKDILTRFPSMEGPEP